LKQDERAKVNKVELHLHLEGAAPPKFIAGLAREKHIDLSGIFTDEGDYRFSGFPEFVRVYEAATSTLQRPEDYARLTTAVLQAQAEQGVVYTEHFLCPDYCGGGDRGAWKEYLHAIREAAAAAEVQAGITMRGIALMIRHMDPDAGRKAAICAAEAAGEFLVGIGIAGYEKKGRIKDFAWGLHCGREAGLHLTLHAGELNGPSEIRAALEFAPPRIGHGVRAIEDLALVDELAEQGTVLECCPGSNIALGLYPDFRHHPIGELLHRGVKVTVSTDDPPFFGTTLTREYDQLAEAFDWDEGVFATLNRTALDAAFCDKDTKARIAQRLEA
jgi:adenosine deaminase